MLPSCLLRSPFTEKGARRSLFDGRTLNGWRGEPGYWSVQDGAITGKSDTPIPHNTFLIHGETFGNFELRFKYRFLTLHGDSGMQYRSRVVDHSRFVVHGNQANIVPVPPDAGQGYIGLGHLRDEDGRKYALLAKLGEQVQIEGRGDEMSREVLGTVNDPAEVLQAVKPYPAWNDYMIVAFDEHLVHVVNRYVTVDVVDNHSGGRPREGVLALQLHQGSPMGVQVKDIEIMELAVRPDLSNRFITKPRHIGK